MLAHSPGFVKTLDKESRVQRTFWLVGSARLYPNRVGSDSPEASEAVRARTNA